jgi:hypothetical protein
MQNDTTRHMATYTLVLQRTSHTQTPHQQTQ